MDCVLPKQDQKGIEAVLLMACLFVVLSACKAKPDEGSVASQKNRSGGASDAKAKVELTIDLPDTDQDLHYDSPAGQKRSVLSLMQELQKKGLRFSAKKTSLGALIESIAGRANQKNCPCWIYAVNGKLAPVGVSEMEVKAGDRVRWCYLKYEDRNLCQ